MSSEDFKSFCRALIPSEVGSIPTRSRHGLPARRLTLRLAIACALLAGAGEAGAEDSEAETVLIAAPFRPSPRGALVRSALVPGWGQLYNRRWVKGIVFAAGRLFLLGRAIDEHRLGADLEKKALLLEDEGERGRTWRERNRAFNRRDDFIWYSAYALLFTMAEAYVDAALMEFGDEFEDVEELGAPAARVLRLGVEVRF